MMEKMQVKTIGVFFWEKSVTEQHNFIVGYFCSCMVYRYTCILGTGLVTSLTANQTQTRNHYYIYIYIYKNNMYIYIYMCIYIVRTWEYMSWTMQVQPLGKLEEIVRV